MAELFPLSDLRDPVAFLMGARVPVSSTSGNRIEILNDSALTWDPYTCTYGVCPLDHGMWAWWSIDLADPDVARWCDRKIGEHLCRCPCYFAGLRIVDGEWNMTLWNQLPQQAWTAQAACLSGIPCDETHIPTARAALIRALYGKEAT